MSFKLDGERVSEWIATWKDSFESINPDPDSMRTLVFLTLLERQGELTSYQDIADELVSRGVLAEAPIDFTPLRNGMSQVVNALKTHSLYEIEKRKTGKESSHRLIRRFRGAGKRQSSGEGRIISLIDDPDLAPSIDLVARKLMRDRRMPFYGIYLPFRAAARWALYSEGEALYSDGEATDRSKYEAHECLRLLDEWLARYKEKEISLIGLGVGEGIGEIEILEALLKDENRFKQIHYCAIDTNVHLLMDHIERLRDKFKEAIKSKRLVCGVVCGNFLETFSMQIQRLRAEFVENGQAGGAAFLPNTGTLVSLLGNIVGNLEQRASEWSYFQPALDELKGYDLAFVLGVALPHTTPKKSVRGPENYSKVLEDLLLATPRYLTHELTMLKSHANGDERNKEFVLPDDDTRKERWPDVVEVDYSGDGLVRGAHVRGKIYEFFYRTKWELSMDSDGEELRIPAGTDLLLYNIIKFDPKSLIEFLESKGLFRSPHEPKPCAIVSGNEDRRYVVIAVTNRAPA